MNKSEIYKEIEQVFGLVPVMFRSVPESSLELEWKLYKRVHMEESSIPGKYKELIGVAISAVTKCTYCAYYHTELAKLNGATDEEIEEVVHFAKSSSGWSTYINGLQVDYDEFTSEIDKATEFVRKNAKG